MAQRDGSGAIKIAQAPPNPPTINPGYGVFSGNQTISMSAQGGATIYYTLDGSTPTTGSTQYTGAFQITSSKTIKAIAYIAPDSSSVTTAYIQIDPSTSLVSRTGLVLWLKADNGVTTSGSNVTAWRDMTSSQHNTSQTTSGSEPQFVSNAVAGLPAVSFDGSTQFMNFVSGFANFNSGATIFIVTKPTAVTANARFFDLGNGATNNNIYVSEPTDNGVSFYVYNGSTASSLTDSSAVTLNQYQLIEVTHNGAGTAAIYTNGVQGAQGTVNNINNVSRTQNFLGVNNGGALFFQGEIAEVLIYNQIVTATIRTNVETYLFNRYQLSVHPPVISPGYGVFSSNQFVTITGDTGATFYYTTDGSTPTTSSTQYTGAFQITSSTTVKAIAVQSWATSTVSQAYLQIDPTTTFTKSGLVLWLKADNGVTTSGSNVTAWQDMTANQNNASQLMSGSEPQFVSSAVAGLPAVGFNGSSQYMKFGSGFANFAAGAAVFIVTKPTAVTANARFFDFGNGATSNNIFMSEPSDTGVSIYVYNGSTASSVTASDAVTLNMYQLVGASHSGSASATLYTNGAQKAQGAINNINNVTRSQNFLGVNNAGTLFFQGEIAEVLIYNRALTAGERAAIETYLFRRYELAVHPPTLSPSYGVFANQQSVTITGDTGASFYYTLDGSTPTTGSTPYTGPFTVSSSTTVKAIAVQTFATSTVSSAYLEIDPNVAPITRTNLLSWFKADNGVVTSGSNVSQWGDMSSTANNAVQATPGNQPTFVEDAINGRPAIRFNGTSQNLQIGSGFINFSSGASIFTVAKPTGTTGGFLVDLSNGATADNITVSRTGTSGATATFTIYRTTTSSLNATDALKLNQHQLVEALYTGSSSGTILINGLEKASGTLNNPFNTTRALNHIGTNHNASANFYQGEIAELLLYNRLLTASERTAVETYLIQKYQLNSLPPPAPIISVPGGTLVGPTQVAVAGIPEATVYYTTDGTTPTTSSTVYNGPINVYYSQTIKAIAVRNGTSSSVSGATYTLDANQWPAPDPSDSTPLNIHLQLPTTAAPH